MRFDYPVYLARADGAPLVAFSLDELCELLACAGDAGHGVDLVHACYGGTWDATAPELAAVARALSQR